MLESTPTKLRPASAKNRGGDSRGGHRRRTSGLKDMSNVTAARRPRAPSPEIQPFRFFDLPQEVSLRTRRCSVA
jgi:hypothetical protein